MTDLSVVQPYITGAFAEDADRERVRAQSGYWRTLPASHSDRVHEREMRFILVFSVFGIFCIKFLNCHHMV